MERIPTGVATSATHGTELDWAEHWRQLVETRRARVEALAGGPQTNFWDVRATRFSARSEAFDASTDLLAAMLREALGVAGTLLDVGAGAGRYAIPLALAASRVTAVEPSPGMRSHLEAAIARAHLNNIVVVPPSWEEAEVEPHDIVLASNVLYPIAEVVPFVRKLDRYAKRAAYVLIRVDQREAPIAPLWQAVWGDPSPPEPGFLDLYNLLFAMGIRANARMMPTRGSMGFASLDDAVEAVRQQLFLRAEQHEHDARIRAYLADTLMASDGGLDWPQALQYAIVWWEQGQPT